MAHFILVYIPVITHVLLPNARGEAYGWAVACPAGFRGSNQRHPTAVLPSLMSNCFVNCFFVCLFLLCFCSRLFIIPFFNTLSCSSFIVSKLIGETTSLNSSLRCISYLVSSFICTLDAETKAATFSPSYGLQQNLYSRKSVHFYVRYSFSLYIQGPA